MGIVFDGLTFPSPEARAAYIGLDAAGRQEWRDRLAAPMAPPVTSDIVVRAREEPLPMQTVAAPARTISEVDEASIRARYFAGRRLRRGFVMTTGVEVHTHVFDDETSAVAWLGESIKLGFDVQTDTDHAVEFMRRWPTERMHLWAKIPDGKIEARTFERTPDGYAAMHHWIEARQGVSNLYFVCNDINVALGIDKRDGQTIVTPLETDVVRMLGTQVDTDPEALLNATPEERAEHYVKEGSRLLKIYNSYQPRFSVINFTGGGVQGFQLFNTPIDVGGDPARIADAKRLNVYLKRDHLGADDCESLQHVMRLPGTINVPDAKKLKRGRKPALAYVARFDDSTLWHDASSLPKAEPEQPKDRARGTFTGAGNYDPIDPTDPALAGLDRKWITLGFEGDLDRKYLHPNGATPDRSRALMAFATAAKRAGIDDLVLARCIMNWVIGECVRDKGKHVQRDLKRIIERATEMAIDKDLAHTNERHCVVEDIGGKCVVLNETTDPVTGEVRVTFSSFEAIANRYGNRKKKVGEADGKELTIPLSQWWFHHANRRQKEHVAFAPGRDLPNAYNLWPGYSVCPDHVDSEKKCTLYLTHVRENICQGNDELYQYVIRWMANAVQHLGKPGGAALVLRGKMGIGKGEFVRHFGVLFGRCFIPVTKAEHITGRFNGHMGECVLLFADECFFPGNPQHEQILKVLVTERRWLIERKGIDAGPSESCLHIILACNNEWSVPVDQDDRRFCCIEVGAAHIRDRAYFEAINEQMNNGGREALLGFLLDVDLTGFNPESFPRTTDQRANTRHGVAALVEEACHEGRLPCASPDHPDVAVTSGARDGRGFDHYLAAVAPMELRRMTPGKVKNALKKQWGCEHWRESDGQRRAGVKFPPLVDLRAKFAERYGSQEWRAASVDTWEAPTVPDRVPF